MEPWINIAGTILGGGLIGAVLTYLLNIKKVDSAKDTTDRTQLVNEFKILLNERKEITDKVIAENYKLVEKLQNRIAYLENEISNLKITLTNEAKEVTILRNQLLLFESSHVDIPLPMWMKDTNGKMIFLNRIYEDYFLLPINKSMEDYIGNTDNAIWDKEIADKFIKNDQKVIRTKKYIRTIEYVNGKDGTLFPVEILKYPRTINGKVIGISGMVLDMNPNEDKIKNSKN